MAARSPRLRQPAAAYLSTALVLDCSVALAWYLEEEATAFTEQLLQTVPAAQMWVPSLWVLEFCSALLGAQRRRRISATERAQIIEQAGRIPLNVDPRAMSLREADELSTKLNLSPSDATYFELARRRGLPLATLDAALVKAARAAKLPVLTDLTLFPV